MIGGWGSSAHCGRSRTAQSLKRFLMDAQRAAREIAGMPGNTPGQLAAAMEEAGEQYPRTFPRCRHRTSGVSCGAHMFEFVAADRGIGILRSLQRCTTYASLPDHGKALEAALTDGTSRFGSDGRRGYGFRPIFTGLTNLRGSLRFRSGDHALLMDGTSPSLTTAQLAQKPLLDGFFASVAILVKSS